MTVHARLSVPEEMMTVPAFVAYRDHLFALIMHQARQTGWHVEYLREGGALALAWKHQQLGQVDLRDPDHPMNEGFYGVATPFFDGGNDIAVELVDVNANYTTVMQTGAPLPITGDPHEDALYVVAIVTTMLEHFTDVVQRIQQDNFVGREG